MEAPKLACKLTTPELQHRKRTIVKELKALLVEKEEILHGYRYKFEGSDNNLELLTDFIKTERLCCPFFEFQLKVPGEGKFCWLELSGPDGVKDFLSSELEF